MWPLNSGTKVCGLGYIFHAGFNGPSTAHARFHPTLACFFKLEDYRASKIH